MTEERHKDEETRMLLLKKGIFPHDYMDSFEKVQWGKAAGNEAFSSKLNEMSITQEDWA